MPRWALPAPTCEERGLAHALAPSSAPSSPALKHPSPTTCQGRAMTSDLAPARSKKQQQFDQYDAFVAYITGLCGKSTKAQADLRTGLGRPLESCAYLHRYLVPRLPEPKRPGWYDDSRRAHYALASLIAARPRTAPDTDKA